MKNKYRILIVHNYYQIPGGEDAVVANEKKLLEINGHTVFLYTRNNSEIPNMSVINKLKLPFNTIFSIKTYKEIQRLITENNIDIIHVHNTLPLISPSVYYAAVKMKIPVVQTIHNFRFLCPAATFYRDNHICEECLTNGLKCSIKNKCYRNSRIQTLLCAFTMWFHRHTGILKKINFISLTEFNKQKLLQLKYINPKKVYIKPNFTFELSNNDSDQLLIENSRFHSNLQNSFIYVGRLDELKGIKVLFNAWKIMGCNAPTLIVCGMGPLYSWCQEYIKENSLNNIKMKGNINNTEVKKLMKECKAFIFPSLWYEAFPMTIIESYSVGLPVIGSNIGNPSYIIEDSVTGIKFNVNDAKSIVDAIKRFSNIGKDHFNRIKEIYLNKYTPESNYKQLIEIYNEVFNE